MAGPAAAWCEPSRASHPTLAAPPLAPACLQEIQCHPWFLEAINPAALRFNDKIVEVRQRQLALACGTEPSASWRAMAQRGSTGGHGAPPCRAELASSMLITELPESHARASPDAASGCTLLRGPACTPHTFDAAHGS